jgi:regulator of sigma E protease
MNAVTTLLAFVVTLGVLIVIHEFGHYWVARRCGVRVLRFSVGFGRPLWKRVYGADRTEWVIGAIPLGGYVRMLDERDPDAGPESLADLSRAFNRQPVAKRIAIVLAGPLANLLLAAGVYWFLGVSGTLEPRAVLAAPPAETIAARAGLRDGDEVVAVDGRAVRGFGDMRWKLLERAVERAPVELAPAAANAPPCSTSASWARARSTSRCSRTWASHWPSRWRSCASSRPAASPRWPGCARATASSASTAGRRSARTR